jgi:hypothetical protein
VSATQCGDHGGRPAPAVQIVKRAPAGKACQSVSSTVLCGAGPAAVHSELPGHGEKRHPSVGPIARPQSRGADRAASGQPRRPRGRWATRPCGHRERRTTRSRGGAVGPRERAARRPPAARPRTPRAGGPRDDTATENVGPRDHEAGPSDHEITRRGSGPRGPAALPSIRFHYLNNPSQTPAMITTLSSRHPKNSQGSAADALLTVYFNCHQSRRCSTHWSAAQEAPTRRKRGPAGHATRTTEKPVYNRKACVQQKSLTLRRRAGHVRT